MGNGSKRINQERSDSLDPSHLSLNDGTKDTTPFLSQSSPDDAFLLFFSDEEKRRNGKASSVLDCDGRAVCLVTNGFPSSSLMRPGLPLALSLRPFGQR